MKFIKIIAFLPLLFALSVFAQDDIPKPQKPQKLVNDFANLLTPSQKQSLESTLVAFDDSTSTQIVIVTVKSLNGHDPAEFTHSIYDSWGVGQKGKDNGVVIMVKPKYKNERGETFIITGYGLEGIIPDAICKRIVENEMIPRFKQNDIYGGLKNATGILMSLASKEFTAYDYEKKHSGGGPPIIIFILFFAIMLFAWFWNTAWRASSYSAYHDVPFWTALWLVMMTRSAHSGKYGDFSSGSGTFGGWGGGSFGGGGGGFGGFGGGSSGGGGAGGS